MNRFLLTILRWLITSFLDIRVQGVERIPTQGGAVIAGNHPNLIDGLVLGVVSPRPVRFLVAADTMRGAAGVFARWMGAIPVDRSGGSNREALTAAVNSLRAGEVIGIFPEGKTSDGEDLLEFKKGVALLAHRTGVPVIPCAFEGTQHVFPRGSRVPKSTTVQVSFGESLSVVPVEQSAVPEEMVQATLTSLRGRVGQLWASIRSNSPRYRWRLQSLAASCVMVPLTWVVSLASGR